MVPRFPAAEASFFETSHPPRNVDIWGYFQVIPAAYRIHKVLIKELLRPSADIETTANAWLRDVYSSHKRIIGLHIRRGDYVDYDENNFSKFSRVPNEFYLDWLRTNIKAGDAVFISTDDEFELAKFEGFPLINKLFDRPKLISNFEGDFFILSQCDIAAYCNSSWSLMAGLLAKEGQEAHIIDPGERRFVAFDPWSEDCFWRRFEPTGYGGLPVDWHETNIQLMMKTAQANNWWKAAGELFCAPFLHFMRYLIALLWGNRSI